MNKALALPRSCTVLRPNTKLLLLPPLCPALRFASRSRSRPTNPPLPPSRSTIIRWHSHGVEMADRIHRVTMFKLPRAEDRARLLEEYKSLAANNSKDGKPYILSMVVGPAEDDPRSQGYTIVSKTEFASMDDMKFYDDECAAHQQLKALVSGTLKPEGVMTVYFKAQAVGGIAV